MEVCFEAVDSWSGEGAERAIAMGGAMTVFYDRLPDEGGMVRIIAVN